MALPERKCGQPALKEGGELSKPYKRAALMEQVVIVHTMTYGKEHQTYAAGSILALRRRSLLSPRAVKMHKN